MGMFASARLASTLILLPHVNSTPASFHSGFGLAVLAVI